MNVMAYVEKMGHLLWTNYPEYLNQLFSLGNHLRNSLQNDNTMNRDNILEQYRVVEEMVANYTSYSHSQNSTPPISLPYSIHPIKQFTYESAALYYDLPKEVPSLYKAAGILPYARTHNRQVKLLLGCEDR